MGMSDTLGNGLLDAFLSNSAYTVTTPYISLHTADPGTTGASEAADGNYAREAGSFGVAASKTASSDATITFASGTGWVGSETLTHVGVNDALTAGNFLMGGALDSSIAVTAGAEVEFAVGNLDISIA